MREPQPMIAKTLQDRLLLEVAAGFSPEEAGLRAWGPLPKMRERLNETGKALRRCGLLLAHDWILTPNGERRAALLRGKELEAENDDGGAN